MHLTRRHPTHHLIGLVVPLVLLSASPRARADAHCFAAVAGTVQELKRPLGPPPDWLDVPLLVGTDGGLRGELSRSPLWPRFVLRNAERLGLSESTRRRIRTAEVAAEREVLDAAAARERARETLHAMLNDRSVEPNRVLSQAGRVLDAERAAHLASIRVVLSTRKELTEEQLKLLYSP